MKRTILLVGATIWITCGYGQKRLSFAASDYVKALKQATDVMVMDVTSPVAASRYYAYINLAANETVSVFDKDQPHFAGTIKGLDAIKVDNTLIKKSDAELATILALYKSAIRLLPSGYLLQKSLDSLRLLAVKRKLPVETVNATVELVDNIVVQVLKCASMDGFARLS